MTQTKNTIKLKQLLIKSILNWLFTNNNICSFCGATMLKLIHNVVKVIKLISKYFIN